MIEDIDVSGYEYDNGLDEEEFDAIAKEIKSLNSGAEQPHLEIDEDGGEDFPFLFFSPEERNELLKSGEFELSEGGENMRDNDNFGTIIEENTNHAEASISETIEEKEKHAEIKEKDVIRDESSGEAEQTVADEEDIVIKDPLDSEESEIIDDKDIFNTGGVDFNSGEISDKSGTDSAVEIGDTVGAKPESRLKKIKHYSPKKIIGAILIFAIVVILLCNFTDNMSKKNKNTNVNVSDKKKENKGLQPSNISDSLVKSEEYTVSGKYKEDEEYKNASNFDPRGSNSDDTAGLRAGYGNTLGQNGNEVYIDANGNPVQPAQGQGQPQNGNLTPVSGGGSNIQQDDGLKERQAALRQQYIELVRQSYMSKPVAEGGGCWNLEKNKQGASNNTVAGAGGNTEKPDLTSPIAKAANLLGFKSEAEMLQKFGGGGGGGTNSATAASQSNKESFFNASGGTGYLKNTRTDKIAPYTLPAGSMIPCALITGINSDLPGNITASVTENVYDWQSAHVCIIPQGCRIFGKYNSSVTWGQKRVQISWNRLVYPDGSTLDLENMPGVDRRGYTGLKDRYDGHYGQMAIAAILTTGFTILPALVENRNSNNAVNTYYGNSVQQTAAAAAAQQIGRMGNKFFDKSLNRQPTVTVRPGTRFNIQVNADIPFYRKWSVVR